MSTTRNVLDICDTWSGSFREEFGFYLDYLDELISIQSSVGFERDALAVLPDEDQDLVKTYRFLAVAGNTTLTTTLRLLSSNLHSDAFGLSRILYEIACIMHYGNISRTSKIEVLRTMFKSGLRGREQSKAEWQLIKKALAGFLSKKPGLRGVVEFLNNYGAHMSREKVVLGNVAVLDDQVVSSLFVSNFGAKRFLIGLEFLYHILAMIQEEYIRHLEDLGGASQDRHRVVVELGKRFLFDVRPKLKAKMREE